MVYITKGTRIRAEWFEAKPLNSASLAGMQMKTEAIQHHLVGTVTHVRGDHPVTPTRYELIVRPDGGGEEVRIKPEWILEVLS